ncbi:hypothetical protein MA16_Dca018399 [Dendrobium catenatum]|uniref:Uncharacterized protein n=1 Tax=Dendrobium catenatum TaxID=906689 RepID=A0A2I0WHM3_9ASPA|nr:hypothetical protein MA16_Dca018399 [Dendrobium catenatum]
MEDAINKMNGVSLDGWSIIIDKALPVSVGIVMEDVTMIGTGIRILMAITLVEGEILAMETASNMENLVILLICS